jgi:hypothetical protein
MEDKIITTSGGYKVTIAPFLNHDQFIEIQEIWTNDAKIDPVTGKPILGEIRANTIYKANRLAVSMLVRKIEGPDGATVVRESNSLPIPPGDGQEVMEEIQKMETEAADSFAKKKAKVS